MQGLRRLRRGFCGFALLALLGLALLPTLSRALTATDASGPWAELCSIGGAKRVAPSADTGTDTGSAPAPGEAATHLEHCPYCSLGGHLVALPREAESLAVPVDAALPSPALGAGTAGRTRPAWAAPEPRGPPTTS